QKTIGLARGGPKQLGLHGLAHYAARALAAQPSAHGNEPGTAVGTLPRDESAQTTPPIPANRVVLLTGAPRAFHLFRRDALGYDGAGGRSAPRRRSIGGRAFLSFPCSCGRRKHPHAFDAARNAGRDRPPVPPCPRAPWP